MTDSEKYVSELCNKSFLPFWSYPNPIGKNNKELCDVLVVCGNVIIIISVKDIKMTSHLDVVINYERWVKKAIEDSVKQIYGAEKFIKNSDQILLKDYKTKIPLPSKNNRKVYRIAIAFGSNPNYPLPMGNFGNGYVSVFDEKSTKVILAELDTITDFIKYLDAKESIQKKASILAAFETDFLAFYLQTGLDFEKIPDSIVLDDKLWEQYEQSESYEKWKDESAISYFWDILVWYIYKNNFSNNINNEKLLEIEEALRIINQEDRIARIGLGIILEEAIKERVQARMIEPRDGKDYTYVFMPVSDINWELKSEELLLRCDVARYYHPNIQKVIGISVGKELIGENVVPKFDLCYINVPEITPEFEAHVKKIQKELGYFTNPRIKNL